MTDESSRRRVLPALFAVLFLLCFAGLVTSLMMTNRELKRVQDRAEKAKAVLVDLQKQEAERKAVQEQYDIDKHVLSQFIQKCRSAEDVPDFGGAHLISNLQGNDNVAFYVPAGNHRLKLEATWTRKPKESPSKTDSDPNEDAAETNEATAEAPRQFSHTIDLLPETGYLLRVLHSQYGRKPPEPIGWELTASRPESETRKITFPVKPIRFTSGSWSSFQVLAYPGAIDKYALFTAQKTRPLSEPVRILRTKRAGSEDDSVVEFSFLAHIECDGPLVIPASEVGSLLLTKREECLGEYLGNGVYGIDPAFAEQYEKERTSAASGD